MKTALFIFAAIFFFYSLWGVDPTFTKDETNWSIPITRREPTIREVIEANFGEEKYMAYKIMKCESNGRPNAVNYNANGTRDSGLFQINSVHAYLVNGDLDSLFDPKVNIQVAKKVYERAGNSWEPWVCAKGL